MITTEGQIQSCGCRSVGECDHNTFAEVRALDQLVDAFAAEMKKKLRDQYYRNGYTGWDDRAKEGIIRDSLCQHLDRLWGQEVDIANLAAFLWNFRQP